MAPAHHENDSNRPRPRVCVCGYDLTGLADAPNLKCPECGVEVEQALLAQASRAQKRAAIGMAFGPAGLATVCLLLFFAFDDFALSALLATTGLTIAVIWLFTVTPMVCIGWVQFRYDWLPRWYLGLVASSAAVVVIVVNILATAAAALLLSLLFG